MGTSEVTSMAEKPPNAGADQKSPDAGTAQKPPDTVYISFTAEINPTTTEVLLKACCELATKGVKTIYLLISTPGGSVACGTNVYNILRALPCKIVTHNVGAVNSIGTAMFLAGEKRYANPGTTFMFHGVGFDARNMRLEEQDLREHLASVCADQTKIGSIITGRTDISKEEIEDFFLKATTKDADSAKDCRIVHEIREAKVPDGAPIIQLVFKR